MTRFGRWGVLALAVLVALPLMPGSAKAWWRGGWGWGGPVVVGIAPPPVYVGPPIYAPPPVYYAPPPAYSARAPARSCYAGQFVCPLERPTPINGPCACPTYNGPLGGRAS